VEIPVTVTSMDRRHAFVEQCVALVISPQGCGFQASQALPLETPVLLSGLPADASASGRVASCLPVGKDGKSFLIGVALYNHGNVWGIADPPEDWNCGSSPAAGATQAPPGVVAKRKTVWPYNLLAGHDDGHTGRK
jgi:hypothetical protein